MNRAPTRRPRRPRDPLDRYMTPVLVADPLVALMQIPTLWRILDPAVGNGAFPRAARRAGHTGTFTAVDVWPEARGLASDDVDDAHAADFLTADLPDVDLVLTNPPFKHAAAFLERALAVAPRVAFLVRSTFLELTNNRRELWRQHRPVLEWTIGERICFLDADDKPLEDTDSVCHTVLFFSKQATPRATWHRSVISLTDPTWPKPVSPWSWL